MKRMLVSLIALALCTLNAKKEDIDKLVSVGAVNPRIKIECAYATYNNFTGKKVYPSFLYNHTFLLKEVAQQLSLVQEELEQQGLGLLIWDALRPMQGQQTLWEAFPDERYVAPPSMGGRHTRGTTVDLTIIDLATGEPLDMGTGFDVFTFTAGVKCEIFSEEVQKNRVFLRDIMKIHGFKQYEEEWWHFDYEGWKNYQPLEITYGELQTLIEMSPINES